MLVGEQAARSIHQLSNISFSEDERPFGTTTYFCHL